MIIGKIGPVLKTPAGVSYITEQGMTLRDYFAAKASEEDIKAHQEGGVKEQVVDDLNGRKKIVYCNVRYTREQAKYRYADAMLKAREA
jgi:hypothetical protein